MVNDIRRDYISLKNSKGNIILPIAHYVLINSEKNRIEIFPKVAVYGLGSCILMILYDFRNKIFGLSHILLPKAPNFKESLKYPHKYADSSVQDLINELVRNGARRKNIRAILIGGAKVFESPDLENDVSSNNAKIVKIMLNFYDINIEKEFIGGYGGRTFLFDPNIHTIFLKSSNEEKFKSIRLK